MKFQIEISSEAKLRRLKMDSEALVHLALKTLSCSQKELALRLNVSPTQISKWKKDEHMSDDMEKKLRAIVNIGNKHPAFVVWAGSLENASKWEKLIKFLAESAESGAETGYDTDSLNENLELLCWQTFHTFREMGVDVPSTFPEELDFCYDETDDPWQVLETNLHSGLIYKIFKALTNVYGFFTAYVFDLIYVDELDLLNTAAGNIEPCLMSLAATKLGDEEVGKLASKFPQFRYRVKKDYVEWLNIVKEKAFRAGIPLRAELLGMVYETDEALGTDAESESLGFNDSRLHPDIYMDELLRGMRMIHQVLPAIMKKLDIPDEFRLDVSELRVS
jgi:transcriptional regulator with XRE-family HTH domain